MLRTQWVNFPQMVKDSLERSLLKVIPDFNEIGMLRFFQGSSNLGYQWIERPEIKKAILRAISNPILAMRMKGNPTIFQYLSDVGIKRDSLPDGTKQGFTDDKRTNDRLKPFTSSNMDPIEPFIGE
jgi:hypothetical protein